MPSVDQLLPHRAPMLLLDQIIELDDCTLTAVKDFKREEFFVQGHYPDFPLVPGVILCECAFQAGAALISNRLKDNPLDKDQVPVISRIQNAKFKRMVRPGEKIVIKVQLVETISNAFFLKGRLLVGEALACTVEFSCTATKRAA